MKTNLLLSLVIFCFAGSVSFASQPEIIAHRGASFEAPENTIAAFELGYKETNICEIDIWMTKDNKIVVSHDDNTSRTTGKSFLIPESNYSDIASLDAGSWKGEKYKGEKIPTLEEVLAVVKGDNKIFIEIKHKPEILPVLAKIIQNHPMKKNIVLIGFKYETMQQAKEMMPEFPNYWLVYPKKNEKTKELIPYDDSLIEKAVAAKLDGLNLNNGTLTKQYVEKAKKAGLGVYVWTVDKPEIALEMAKIGVDGITTNKPLYLKNLLAKKK